MPLKTAIVVDLWPPHKGKPKMFYRIGEVARMTDLKSYVLRYWENEFPKYLKPPLDASGQRRYRQADIDTILTIKDLLYVQRKTINGANKALSERKPA